MQSEGIHETVVRDIVDIAQGIKDSDDVKRVANFRNGNSFKSIANKVEGLTVVFPVIASRNISYEAAAMIAKATERKGVAMLQMLFSAANITDAKNGFDYLSKFHTNLDMGSLTVDKFMDAMDNFVEENGLITESNQYEQYENIKRDLKNMNFYFENDINTNSLNNYKIVNVEGTQLFINEAKNKANAPQSRGKADDGKDDYRNSPEYLSAQRDNWNASASKSVSDTIKSTMDINTHRLIDNDIKKANELMPTLMYVNFVTITPDSQQSIDSSMIIGVKAKLYAVDSQDILNRLKIKHNDKNLVLGLIKAGTREISFFKDFLFAVDKAKIDAMSQSRRGSSSKIWKVLERRAIKSKVRRSLFMNNDAAAISTLCISQEEVEYLKKTEYIDVENPRVINPIMDAYNLMGFVIVDESLDIAKFIYDTGDDIYEVLTFNNLERETRDNTKKIINLMSKMSR